MNLLEETLAEIAACDNTPADVAWVGTYDGSLTSNWEQFAALAKTVDYNNGYGAQEINPELVIVFKDGAWLERAEYDGSEWWALKVSPFRTVDSKPLAYPDDLLSTRARHDRKNG